MNARTDAASLAAGAGMCRPRDRVGLSVSLSAADPVFLDAVLPLVDGLEVDPEVMSEYHRGHPRIQPQALELIAQAAQRVPILIHGTGLSLGSHEGPSDGCLRLLDQVLGVCSPLWHSEHLGTTLVDGEFLGTMLTLPRTEVMLEMVCRRVQAVQRRYPQLPFLLENIVRLLPDEPADFGEAAFLNAIVRETGCGLLLDLYNLECDAHNNGLNLTAFLDELNLDAVREFHLANGQKHDGLLMDVHVQATREETVALARVTAPRCAQLDFINFEVMKDALNWLGLDGVAEELRHLRTELLA